MVKLKDIVNKMTSGSTGLLNSCIENKSNSTELASRIGNSMIEAGFAKTGISDAQVARFSSEVSSLISKDSFIDELDNRIGKPQPNESEDIFVNRAKNRMREILREKLK